MAKAVNGKNKGNTFERKMANVLSDRFKDVLGIEKGFRRNPDSGSYFGGANVARTNQYDLDNACFGDIMCPKEFKFTIECKHYKTPPTFQSLVQGSVAQWDKWLSQAEQDSVSASKNFLLIIKYNNVDEIVFMKEKQPVKEILTYKDYYAYKLKDILDFSDSFFV